MDKIRSVAVIGAGISGVCAAAHLLRQGLEVTVYERSSIAGGVWHFDPRSAHEPEYPNEDPSRGDYERHKAQPLSEEAYGTPPATPHGSANSPGRSNSSREASPVHKKARDDRSIAHAPPGPCYAGLQNNVSLTCMKTSLHNWPPGLEEFVSQRYLEQYIQNIARRWKVDAVTQNNTRVDEVRKVDDQWRVVTTYLDGESSRLQAHTSWFDAVVVASGHYNMPRVPDIPGLKTWKQRYPERIMHSKGYRDASKYKDKTVLLIGAGVSSIDIAKEIVLVGGKVVQSSRGGMFDLPASMLPEHNARRVGGLERFELDWNNERYDLELSQGIPGTVVLASGEIITKIDHVILGTGYITSYPFLNLHADQLAAEDADEKILVTKEGNMVQNLYKDIFYIPDPTLSFIGAPYHVSTFSLFDFQGQVVSRVLAGKAILPSQAEMRSHYDAKLRAKGYGRDFHSLRADDAEINYVSDLVEWVNTGVKEDSEKMQGHTDAWLTGHRLQREMLKARKIVVDKVGTVPPVDKNSIPS